MNKPKLPEQLRNQAPGIIVVHYKDGDMRQRVFDHSLIEMQLSEEVEDGIVTKEDVLKVMVPSILKIVNTMREEEGEPEHAGYEMYWSGNLIWSEPAPQYVVVPFTEEENPAVTHPTHTDLMVPPEGLNEYINQEAEEEQE